MKNILLLTALLLTGIGVLAQAPQKMSYQSVVRNSNDELVTNSNIGVQLSIIQYTISGTAVFVERHFPTTNANGLVSLGIGTGTVVTGSFSSVDWSDGPYFIKSEIDLNGGANYTISGTTELLSVPYALHAKTAEIVTENDPYYNASVARAITANDTASWNSKLDDFDETDPVFGASIAGGIVAADTMKWNAKMDSYTETDPVFNASIAGAITGTDTTNWNNKLDSYTETDPLFDASVAKDISVQDTTRWGTDADAANEIQDLSIAGNVLSLTGDASTVTIADSVMGYSAPVTPGFGTSTTLDLATVSFTLQKQRTVLILADVNVWGSGTPCEETIRLSIDGSPVNNSSVHIDIQAAVGGNNGDSAVTSWMTILPAGSHTVKLRAWNGSCPFHKHAHLHVLVLGN